MSTRPQTVGTRFDDIIDRLNDLLDMIVGGHGVTGTAGGDLSGTYPNPVVVALRGIAISTTLPTVVGQVLTYDGTQYTPAVPASGADDWVYWEVSPGNINSVNAVFPLSQLAEDGKVFPYVNNRQMQLGSDNDFTSADSGGVTVVTFTAGAVPQKRSPADKDKVWFHYRKAT